MDNYAKRAAKLIERLKPTWPKPMKYLGSGGSAITFNTNNGRVLKFSQGKNPIREVNALKHLQNANFVPRFRNGNYVMIKKSQNIENFLGISGYMGKPVLRNGQSAIAFIQGKVGGNKGMNLHTYLKKFPNGKQRVVNRILPMLEYMQMKRISHRDLQPANIIVTVDSIGRITGMWIIDFGNAEKIVGPKNNKNIKNLFMYLNLPYPNNANAKVNSWAKKRVN